MHEGAVHTTLLAPAVVVGVPRVPVVAAHANVSALFCGSCAEACKVTDPLPATVSLDWYVVSI
jgi:hypothetical protein